MNSATEHRTCPSCGTAIPANAPQGICPKCLMAAAAVVTEAGQTGGKRPEPPSLERLAAAFPQLEVIEFIGQGGMGAVYKARQKQLDRIVALKVLPPGIGGDPSFAERFTREAKALAKLLHPNIVALFEFGQADGIYYLLMEYVDGVSLGQLLRSSRVSPREALAIVPQICDALQYAHDQGIVHRDIKPENILLDRRGRVKVADFGLAKLVEANAPLTPSLSPSDGARGAARLDEDKSPVLTAAGKIMGTPNYMAPEQMEHPGEVDHRADIYALGVVFYQMLTGELPGKRLEPPSKKVLIDVRLDEVVLRALERNPQLRYQHVSEVKTCVETILNSGSAAAPSIGQVGARGPKFAWIGSLPNLNGPLVLKRGNRRVLNRPVIGINILNGLFLICVLLPIILKGLSCNESDAKLIELLFIGFLVVFYTVRLVHGFMLPSESPPARPGIAPAPARGRDYRTPQILLGLPLVHVAWGIDPATGRPRVAKGIVAVGPVAIGVIAVGFSAWGLCPCGLVAGGFWATGLFAVGFWAVGLAAAGFQAVGLLALAFWRAVGLVAVGSATIGLEKIVVDKGMVGLLFALAILVAWLMDRLVNVIGSGAAPSTTIVAKPRQDWWTWWEFQSPEVGQICAHLTKAERKHLLVLGLLYGVWGMATIFGIPALNRTMRNPGDWMVSAVWAGLFIVPLPMIARMMRHFFCSTDWARKQEITPDKLRLFSFRSTPSEARGPALLVLVVLLLTLLVVEILGGVSGIFSINKNALQTRVAAPPHPQPNQGQKRHPRNAAAQPTTFRAGNFSVPVPASSNAPFHYEWRFNGANIPTAATNAYTFGPVIERVVNLEFGTTNCAIDLDSGRLMDGRDDVEEQGADAAGLDFLPISNPTLIGLGCINETFAMLVDATNWDNGGADWVRSRAAQVLFCKFFEHQTEGWGWFSMVR